MVSIYRFRHELLAQCARAAQAGRIQVLINSAELCRFIRGGSESASCDAMQAEYMPGDKVLLGRSNGAGMTVRYLLPRDQCSLSAMKRVSQPMALAINRSFQRPYDLHFLLALASLR